ncbi:MAG: NADH-quinone oxidoreductase subunit L [Fidelibacterota bacterium]
MITYGLLILILPLAAFAVQIFVGRRLPREGDWVSVGAVVLTLCIALAMFGFMLYSYDYDLRYEATWTWFDLGAMKMEVGVLIDTITVVMLLVVAVVSSLCHIYSIGYMAGDPRYARYFAYLSLFTFSMNGIVLSDNLFTIYIFWELVGLSSYLLIGFWFERDAAADAGKKAFLVNRIGDIGMFIGILIFFTATGSFLFTDVFEGVAAGIFSPALLTVAGLCIFAGAVGKSAQFPLHVWLPDAMEGPTPVSALIHAATMVAAGVYLSVRLFPIFRPEVLTTLAYVGGFTALFAATIALTQNDIKRVLAYSTVSQLGYMIMAVGTGAYVAGLFHLVTHAAFKAGLFLSSGSVIHAMHHAYHSVGDHQSDAQDMRNMGGLKERMKITYWSMVVFSLAISGIPFTSGFLSKDAILAGTVAFAAKNSGHFLLPVFGFGAALLTAFYMFRLIFLTFHGTPARKDVYENVRESPSVMTAPLVTLAVLSVFLVYTLPYWNPFSAEGWFSDLVVATDSAVPGHVNPTAREVAEGIHHAHVPAMFISILVALAGIGLAIAVYLRKVISAQRMAKRFGLLYRLSFRKYFIDEIYHRLIVLPSLTLSKVVGFLDWDLYDKHVINGFGRITARIAKIVGLRLDFDVLDQQMVDGLGRGTRLFGAGLRLIQTGKLQNYLLLVLGGIIVIFIIQVM